MRDPQDALSETTRLGILQGRFEALHQRAAQVEPRHLLLGLLKTMPEDQLTALGLHPEACARLITDLGSTLAPAPLSANEIEYAEACFLEITAAIQHAEGKTVDPADLVVALRKGKMTR